MKLLSTLAYLCISKRHCCAVLVEIRYTQRCTLCVVLAHLSAQDQPISTNTQLTLYGTILHFWQHYLVTAYMATIVVIQSLSVCAPSFFSPHSRSLYLYLSLISNLHLTPSWGKASHSSTVFVPVTSGAPPAYQYQLRQC